MVAIRLFTVGNVARVLFTTAMILVAVHVQRGAEVVRCDPDAMLRRSLQHVQPWAWFEQLADLRTRLEFLGRNKGIDTSRQIAVVDALWRHTETRSLGGGVSTPYDAEGIHAIALEVLDAHGIRED